MNGDRVLLDTNVVLYLLSGKLKTTQLIEGRYAISFVTELELLSYPFVSESEETSIKDFIQNIEIVDLTPEIKQQTIALRKKYKLKLPDAIICATAVCEDASLITFDKSFEKVKELKLLFPKK